ncbi:MAG: VanZ family protein [Acidobacteria bacterium]|nr:VanZ family protein [Acidobacteriota bacterium]MCL5287511.1 VanZ family protein [Acidobacteriota bacterium]
MRALKHWWRAICWAGLIYFFSTGYFNAYETASLLIPIFHRLFPSLSPEELHQIHYLIRKAMHVLNYLVLSFLVLDGVRGEGRGWRWGWGRQAILICTAYAALDEWHQSFVPWRGASVADVFLDGAGATVAQLMMMMWYRVSKTGGASSEAHL